MVNINLYAKQKQERTETVDDDRSECCKGHTVSHEEGRRNIQGRVCLIFSEIKLVVGDDLRYIVWNTGVSPGGVRRDR